MGWYVDIYKFSGGSFALMPEDAVRELIDVCHEHDVEVSTGGSSRTYLCATTIRSMTTSPKLVISASTSLRSPADSSRSMPPTWSH
ncbi:phosphosulfolactate synthase [Halogeometricum sp. S1BR25-6]|uniref:Phosphosulfolactate synthase n=1 Tax=Halogeometricum salsisoli TaxID=2950536 RepID=A0ABU2GKN8_9EURY|nr:MULTISPECIES: phosphosulfolactate synthase [Haloferacaceae]MDS0301376.1 phosphosulfolactate synthase [Halogeometricum sp. S1BR25-6]